MIRMRCTACKCTITIHDLDGGFSIEAVNPMTFREGKFHIACYQELLDEADVTPSKHIEYESRLDEYTMKFN